MSNYLQKIQALVAEVEIKQPERIVVDYFHDLETNLISNGAEDDSIERTDVLSEHYKIEVLLDVIDKKFVIEIALLKRVLSVLHDWYDSLS